MMKNLLQNLGFGFNGKNCKLMNSRPLTPTLPRRWREQAFTLAEVLIVIGIIGVVAALTLPNLNHATGDKEKVTKVKKIYSTLTEAVDRAQAIHGPFDTWFKDIDCVANKEICSEIFAKRVTEFMKVSKDCGFNEGCFSSAPLLLLDESEYEDNYFESLGAVYMIISSDGIAIAFDGHYLHIRLDIDGPNKGKNQMGYDIFDFSIGGQYNGENANQLYPSARPKRWTGNYDTENLPGNYATAWVIENGNLDYLKCYDELNWETKTSCE